MVLVALSTILAGCGGGDSGSSTELTTTTASPTATTTQPPLTSSVVTQTSVAEETPQEPEPTGIAMAGPGETCGAVTSTIFPNLSGKEANIESGTVDCVEAYEILMTYVNTEADPGGDNTNTQTFGDWTCQAPTAVSSEQLQQSVVCTKPSGERIFLPN